MQLQIKRISNGELPLVDTIPDYGVAQLEGYNGVGKTLTVRLLEVCSGKRPPLRREVWQSFCDGLGRLTVTSTRLRGADELVWEVDGKQLRRASDDAGLDAQPETDWFASITLDGAAASMDEVRALFVVERLAGDVGLIEMLAGQADAAAAELLAFQARIESSPRLAAMEQAVAELLAVFAGYSSTALLDHRSAAQEAQREREAAHEVLQRAINHQEALVEISQIRARLFEVADEAEELDRRIAELNDQIAAVRGQRDSAAVELSAAETAASKSDDVRAQLAKAERQYRRASADVQRLSQELAGLEQLAGVGDSSDLDEVAARLAEVGDATVLLERRRNEIDAGPALVRLVDTLRPPLTGAVAGGLGDVELLNRADDSLNGWTVNEVTEGLASRRDALLEIPSPREAVSLDDEIRALRAAKTAIDQIGATRRRLSLAVGRQNSAQEASKALSAQLDAAVVENLDRLRSERRAHDDHLYQVAAERTVLVHRRDALGAPEERDALSNRLQALVLAAGLELEALDAALAEADRRVDVEREAFAQLQAHARATAAQLDRDVADVQAIIARLSESPEFAWIHRDPTPLALPRAEQTIEEQLVELDAIARAAEMTDRRFAESRQVLLGVRGTLAALSNELRSTPEGSEAVFVRYAELKAALAEVAVGWFAHDEVRKELLGPGATEVTVDLSSRQVAWHDADGTARTKPLEGLSSGEQAFAFTQARLALLQHEEGRSARNRLIVLDEFGAFVSHDRMGPLYEYLQSWRGEHDADQLLLILPANQDYEALAKASSPGAKRERYERIAQKLSDKQWFVEEFEP